MKPALALAAALLFCAAAAGAEPRFSFHSTPGKLPKDVVPKHYALRIVLAATHERIRLSAGHVLRPNALPPPLLLSLRPRAPSPARFPYPTPLRSRFGLDALLARRKRN